MMAFRVGTWIGTDAKAFAREHLKSLGLGEVVNPDLLDDFERNFMAEKE